METLFWLISFIVYCALGLLALWGAFCVILAYRRVAQVRFRDEADQNEFLDALGRTIQEGDLKSAVSLCGTDRRAMPQLALYALTNRAMALGPLRHRLVERFERDVLADLEHRLSWINTVIKGAPMVGLLGTVIGMMGAFAKLSSGDHVDPTRLAQDIHFALITTAFGLAIAIPLVMCTASINVRVRKMQDLVDSGLSHLFDLLESVEQSRSVPSKRGVG